MAIFGFSYAGFLVSIAGAWITYVVLRLIRVRRFYRDLPKPPHSFLWGHLKLFGEITALFPPLTHPQYFYSEIAKRYSMPDVWYVDLWPVGPAQMVITGAEAAAEVAVVKVFPIHHWVSWWLALMLGPNVIAGINGPAWKALHHMMGPSFTPMAVKSQVSTIIEHVLIFREKLSRLAETGDEFSMVDLSSKVIFDIISSVVLGFSLKAQQAGSPLLDDFQTSFELAQPYVDTWNPLTKLRIWWKMRGARLRTEKYVYRKLRERYEVLRGAEALPARKSVKTVMDRMLVQRIEEMGDKAGRELDLEFMQLITPNLKGLLAGGQGTTADTTCFIFMFLSLYPDVMKRLRDEHDRVFDPAFAATVDMLTKTPAKVNELEYTNAVIKETLRMFPVGFNVREAPAGQSALEYKGTHYPIRDQMILAVQHASHFNPEYFPEPTKFLPDRFLDSYEPKAHRYAWRPFERGPRACMGQELAMDEMRILLLLTARWFDFETVIRDVPTHTEVTFSDWETKIGELAYQELRMSAGPRAGMPMRVKSSGRS